MQAALGRPPSNYTPNRPPYSQPGTARPPRRGQDRGQQKGPTPRQLARDNWAKLLAGPTFLEPGPSNRLVLSLRSYVPAEVDFAIERLVQISSIDPDLLRFNELPGLLDGLLNLVRDYLDRRIQDRRGGAQSLSIVMNSEARETMRRRAAEAALILRNLALEKRSVEPLLESKRFKKVVVQMLEEGDFEGPEGEETTELRLYLLEVLEVIGEHIPLAIPGHAIALSPDADENTPLPKPEPLDSPSVRLFPLLVALTRSQDRALVLAAYRSLTVLSLNDKSDSVFALLTYEALPPLPKPHPHPVQTAIQLLPLADVELNSVILDFIYQHTLLPSNAAYFCARPELLQILRLVCSKFQIGAKVEEVETEILKTNSEGSHWFKNNFPEKAKGLSRKPIVGPGGEILLSEEELNEVVMMKESDRAVAWMHRMYEVDPASDITQVSLWTAYKVQFEPVTQNPAVPAMLAAQDVIKLAGVAYPSAIPTIIDGADRKFIIKGLKARRRTAGSGECGWEGCPAPIGHDSPLAFHQHVYNSHLALTTPPSSCLWSNCTYVPSSTSDPSLRLAQLTLHTRIHLPFLTPNASLSSSSSDPPPDLPPSILNHVRYHAQVDEHHEASGPGFLACLILRNLTRAAKFALESSTSKSTDSSSKPSDVAGGGRVSVASGNAAIGRLAEGEQSIFEAFAIAEEGSSTGKKGGILSQVEKVDWEVASPAIQALGDVQDTVLRTALSNVVLGKYLKEVVVTIEELKASSNRGRGEEEEGDTEMKE